MTKVEVSKDWCLNMANKEGISEIGAGLTTTQHDAQVERVARAIAEADAGFGYSFNLTRLVDGEATHTLSMPGFDPVEFSDDRDEGYRLIDQRRNLVRARAVIAALDLASRQPAGVGEPHVFLDCDGVLADFDTYAEAYFGMPPREYEKQMGSSRFWQELEAKGDFYRNLPLMPDAMALYEGVKHLHPTILTGCPRGDWAQGQKVAWAAEHFPGVPIITCRSADKRDYAKPGDVLIDDWPQHRHRWIEMGGVFIVHHDAESSLAALRAHYPNLPAAPATETGEMA